MTSLLSYIPGVSRLSSTTPQERRAINIPPVEAHDVETDPGRRASCLKYLIKANHVNHSILYHNLQFDNHVPHALSSAYLLGATEEQLHAIYAAESKDLEPWEDSPSEVIEEDWRDFLGDKRFQRAYLDFFEDALALKFSYLWKPLVENYLLKGERPLIHGLIGGLGHPLIHLGYAYEINSKHVATEALALASVQYNYLHKYLDDKSYSKRDPESFTSGNPLELLSKVARDKRFDGLFAEPDFSNIQTLFDKRESVVLEYWNGWDITDPVREFEKSQEAAVALLVASVSPGTHAYNFFIVHILTTSHAVRTLLPVLPSEFHIDMVRAWWLLTLAVYIAMLRPLIDPDNVESDLKGRHWTFVEHQALNSQYATDAHYVKAIRAMKEAARTWGDVHERYLASALTFVDNFRGWVF